MFLYVFPFAVAALDLAAGIVYAVNKQWALAITWILYAGAAVSLGLAGGK